jgi:DNA-binding protein HU-beta
MATLSTLAEGLFVNKAELVDQIADASDISKASAGRALDAVLVAITNSLKAADPVSLVGFGTFVVRERAARLGRNPQTGAEIQISAAKVPAFKPGKALKEALN